jgi:hypothetical protein
MFNDKIDYLHFKTNNLQNYFKTEKYITIQF